MSYDNNSNLQVHIRWLLRLGDPELSAQTVQRIESLIPQHHLRSTLVLGQSDVLDPTNFLRKARVHVVSCSDVSSQSRSLPRDEFWLVDQSTFNPSQSLRNSVKPVKSPINYPVIYVSIYVDSFLTATSRTHSLGT